MAGSGKRGDQRKISVLKLKNYFGKHGFKPKGQAAEKKCINIEELERLGKDSINLKEFGYDKLLGKGKPSRKYTITVKSASEKAVKKIESCGGTVKTEA